MDRVRFPALRALPSASASRPSPATVPAGSLLSATSRPTSRRERKISGGASLVGLLMAKGGKLLKVAKSLKLLKVLLTVSTMALSALAYSSRLGWPVAAGFVLLLLVHELGHVIALRARGIRASAPVFIPFLGAVVFTPRFTDRQTEAVVGIGGPLLGTLGALATFGLWAALPSHPGALLAVSYLAIYLNLFNLIPISPLDGGRITQAMGGWTWVLGVGALTAVTANALHDGHPGMLLIWLIVLSDWNGPALARAALALGVYAAMSGAYALGMTTGVPGWEVWFDVLVGATLLLAPVRRARTVWRTMGLRSALQTGARGLSEQEPVATPLPPLSRARRWRWAVAYVALALLLGGTMAVQMPLLHALLPARPAASSTGAPAAR